MGRTVEKGVQGDERASWHTMRHVQQMNTSLIYRWGPNGGVWNLGALGHWRVGHHKTLSTVCREGEWKAGCSCQLFCVLNTSLMSKVCPEGFNCVTCVAGWSLWCGEVYGLLVQYVVGVRSCPVSCFSKVGGTADSSWLHYCCPLAVCEWRSGVLHCSAVVSEHCVFHPVATHISHQPIICNTYITPTNANTCANTRLYVLLVRCRWCCEWSLQP